MQLSDFQYELPEALIARYPLEKRSQSRLLCLDRKQGHISHRIFSHIVDLLQPGDLLVCNNTKVIAARMFGCKQSGGKVEMLIERILDDHRVLAHLRASKPPKPGQLLAMTKHEIPFVMEQRHNDLFELRCLDAKPVLDIIETYGELPLPPYFNRAPEESDNIRYQTIYATEKGSVAAPTAGLHFDETVMAAIKNKGIEIDYVTLHIGAGTFAPVRIEDITKHRMHAEYAVVSEDLCEKIRRTKKAGGRVIAVGTTAARSLETASRQGSLQAFKGETDIFIYPGVAFHCIDGLITNLHLPGSTLLMLVSAFAGLNPIKRAYQAAVEEQYRFFSYGDAMFIADF